MIKFKEISQSIIAATFPSYLFPKTKYYAIEKDENVVGFYGIIKRNSQVGESFITIFPDCRYKVFGRRFMIDLFRHASLAGFKELYTWTYLNSWKKLLLRFSNFNVIQTESPYWDKGDEKKMWFKIHCKKETV